MARFILQALPASFTEGHNGALMVTVRMRAVPLIRREVECKSEDDAKAAMAAARGELERVGVPYSMRLTLADKRAPRGFKAWSFLTTREDNAMGEVGA